MGYAILVDGEPAEHVSSAGGVRAWLAQYREEHVQDDPSATHVQVIERGAFAWLVGGKLVDRERFF
jgi:hypothetical protein